MLMKRALFAFLLAVFLLLLQIVTVAATLLALLLSPIAQVVWDWRRNRAAADAYIARLKAEEKKS